MKIIKKKKIKLNKELKRLLLACWSCFYFFRSHIEYFIDGSPNGNHQVWTLTMNPNKFGNTLATLIVVQLFPAFITDCFFFFFFFSHSPVSIFALLLVFVFYFFSFHRRMVSFSPLFHNNHHYNHCQQQNHYYHLATAFVLTVRNSCTQFIKII